MGQIQFKPHPMSLNCYKIWKETFKNKNKKINGKIMPGCIYKKNQLS